MRLCVFQENQVATSSIVRVNAAPMTFVTRKVTGVLSDNPTSLIHTPCIAEANEREKNKRKIVHRTEIPLATIHQRLPERAARMDVHRKLTIKNSEE